VVGPWRPPPSRVFTISGSWIGPGAFFISPLGDHSSGAASFLPAAPFSFYMADGHRSRTLPLGIKPLPCNLENTGGHVR
jgi:hypothetical protein